MAIDPEILRNVEQVRNATYGKDVREAIARGLELCYGYTSGQTADEAAQRANTAAESVEGLIEDSEQAVRDVRAALTDLDYLIEVSETTPTHDTNKIWIQPQDDTEYKVATFAAYEALWERMNGIDQVYQQGHGGIVSIAIDEEYEDLEDELRKRYVITYSDGSTGEFFISDGPEGPTGPIDQIASTKIYYKKVSSANFTPTPPTTYSDTMPTLDPGDYLWTITEITYGSGSKAYIYGLTRMGLNGRDGVDGLGAVHSVALGLDGEELVGNVHLPMDSQPTAQSSNLLSSGAVYEALQNASSLDSPAFTGTPTAPTPQVGDDSTKLATTAFVQQALESTDISAKQITVTMNDVTMTYVDSSITEDTAVIALADIDYSKFSSPIVWETSSDNGGQLTLTTATAPTSSVTFKVLLMNATDAT